MNKKILLCDSCAGGLSVLRFFIEDCGGYEIYYLADGEKNPFGLKSKKEIEKIVESWLKKFGKEIAVLCISCNTASISIINKIRKLERKYNVPIITMIDGAKEALNQHENKIKDKNILLIGTKFTIKSKLYRNLIMKKRPKNIFEIEGTFSERFVARGLEKDKKAKKEMIKELSKFKDNKIDNVFLGCTCYPFIEKEIRKIYGRNINIIDISEQVFKKVYERIDKKNVSNKKKKCSFYITGEKKEWAKNMNIISKKALKKNISVQKINISR